MGAVLLPSRHGLPAGSQCLHTWGVLIMLLIIFVLRTSFEFVGFSICILSLSFLWLSPHLYSFCHYLNEHEVDAKMPAGWACCLSAMGKVVRSHRPASLPPGLHQYLHPCSDPSYPLYKPRGPVSSDLWMHGNFNGNIEPMNPTVYVTSDWELICGWTDFFSHWLKKDCEIAGFHSPLSLPNLACQSCLFVLF